MNKALCLAQGAKEEVTLNEFMRGRLTESEGKMVENLKEFHQDVDQHLVLLAKTLEMSDHNHLAPQVTKLRTRIRSFFVIQMRIDSVPYILTSL